MGFDRGELLAGLAAILCVEGSFDRYVLEGLLGAELRAARIAVRSFGGTHNITEILADPLIAYTTARVAVLVDNVSARELAKLTDDERYRARRAGEGRNESAWLARLLQGADRHRRKIAPFGLSVRDMFFLLDDPALRRVSVDWPGHEVAWERWEESRAARDAPPQGWKAYSRDEFGVEANNTTLRKATAHMRERGAIPDELRDVMDAVERLGLETH